MAMKPWQMESTRERLARQRPSNVIDIRSGVDVSLHDNYFLDDSGVVPLSETQDVDLLYLSTSHGSDSTS